MKIGLWATFYKPRNKSTCDAHKSSERERERKGERKTSYLTEWETETKNYQANLQASFQFLCDQPAGLYIHYLFALVIMQVNNKNIMP